MTTAGLLPLAGVPPSTTPPLRDYLSFSQISTYRSCSLKYFFKYIVGLPEETVSASLVFGCGIHNSIEHHMRELMVGNQPPTIDDLMDHYGRGWTERNGQEIRFGKGDNRKGLDALAKRMLEAFQANAMARPEGRILAVEETLRGELLPDLPQLLGRVDLIVETPDELVISDWKTSRSRWSAEQADDAAEQLLLYAELARDFAPGKRIRIEFSVLTKTKEISIDHHRRPFDQKRLDRTKHVIQRVQRAIDGAVFYPSPSPMNCGLVPVSRALPEVAGLTGATSSQLNRRRKL